MNATTLPRRPANPSVRFVFWLTAAMVLLNVVWIPTLLGLDRAITWIVTAVMLSGQLLLASLAFRVPLRRALGAPGLLIVAALASYLVIGSIMAIGLTPYPFEDVLKYGYALVAVVASAVGGSLVLRQAGSERLAKGILVILGVTSILTLASPVLDDVFTYAHRDAYYRFFSVFTDPNDTGYVSCLTVVAALALLSARRDRKLAGAVLGLSTVGAPILHRLADFCRGGGIMAFVVIAPNRVPFLHQDQIIRLMSISELSEPSAIEDSRLRLWRGSLSRIAESPVLGSDLGEEHYDLGGDCGGQVPIPCGPHNTYLLFL